MGQKNLHYDWCTGRFLGPPHGTTAAAVIAKYYPNGAKYIKYWLENISKPIINFLILRIFSLISKDRKENIICTMDDVRGDVLEFIFV